MKTLRLIAFGLTLMAANSAVLYADSTETNLEVTQFSSDTRLSGEQNPCCSKCATDQKKAGELKPEVQRPVREWSDRNR